MPSLDDQLTNRISLVDLQSGDFAAVEQCGMQAYKFGFKLLIAAAVLLVLPTVESPAQGEDLEMQCQIQSLQRQLDELKAHNGLDRLPEPVTEDPYAAKPVGYYLQAASAAPRPHTVPLASPASEFPKVRLTGFFQADGAWFDQQAANRTAVGDIQDDAGFRRARLAAVGSVAENVAYSLEMDFAFPGRPSFMDVWMEVQNVGPGNFRIGQFRQPFGMSGQTSAKELTFLERGLPQAFLPFRQIGMMYYGHADDESGTWAVSGFRFPTGPFGGNLGDNGGYGMAARGTHLMVDHGNEGGILHVGGGYSYIDPSGDRVQYQTQPEYGAIVNSGNPLLPGLPTSVPAFVNTGVIPASNVNLFNGELAASHGSFYAQSEVFYAIVNEFGPGRQNFSGAYAHAGYFLTGESRLYNRNSGVFGTVTPLSPFGPTGPGAWEVAARWSYIDLDSGNVLGGRLNNGTFGLNWYLNKNSKFQFNYIHAFLNSSSAQSVGGAGISNSVADIFAVRAQVSF